MVLSVRRTIWVSGGSFFLNNHHYTYDRFLRASIAQNYILYCIKSIWTFERVISIGLFLNTKLKKKKDILDVLKEYHYRSPGHQKSFLKIHHYLNKAREPLTVDKLVNDKKKQTLTILLTLFPFPVSIPCQADSRTPCLNSIQDLRNDKERIRGILYIFQVPYLY